MGIERQINMLMRSERLYPFHNAPPKDSRGWVRRDHGLWFAWASQHCFAAAFGAALRTPSGMPEPLQTKIANERFVNALGDAIDAKTEACDVEALRAWVVSLVDLFDEDNQRVELAGVQFDPRLLLCAAPLVVLGAELRLGALKIGDADAVVIRGDGWLWCGAGLAPNGAECSVRFSVAVGAR